MFALFHKTPQQNKQTQLLADEELAALRLMAEQLNCSASPVQTLESRQAGNLATRALGSGLDYAESRPYQHGDDPRSINWRLSARSTDTFVKTYHIEARPTLNIVLDRRHSLYFGTRVRLKIAQALRLASLLGYASELHQLTFKGWILGDAVLHEFDDFDHFLLEANHYIKPDLTTNKKASFDLNLVLPKLFETTQQGSLVYLLSDFYDLNHAPATLLSHLAQLQERYFVQALHLVDIAECQLPSIGKVRLQDWQEESNSPVQVNTCQEQEQQAFSQFAQEQLSEKEKLIRQCGALYTRIMTSDQAIDQHLQIPLGLA